MLAQPSPNYFACLPTAFAIALDVPVRDLLSGLGFDGAAIIFDDAEEPECRRAWHYQDFLETCLVRGYAPLLIEAIPTVLVNGTSRELPLPKDPHVRLSAFMTAFKGVILGTTGLGKRHAVAWESSLFYNTDGKITEECDLEISEFIAFVPLGKELTTFNSS
jgi:hypothetical protein